MASSTYEANTGYLVKLVSLVTLSATAFGMALVTTDELALTYNYHQGIIDIDRQENRTTWLTCSSALGLMIGSLFASTIVKIGRRKAILLASIVSLVGALIQFSLSYWVLIVGKIIYGSSAGVLITACALYLSESLPSDKVGTYGFAVNFGVTLGITLILILGAFNKDLGSNEWILVAVALPVVAICNFLSWLFILRNEPLDFCIQNDQKGDYHEQALANIRLIYRIQDEDIALVEEIFKARQNAKSGGETEGLISNTVEDEPGTLAVLSDPRFRNATYIGIMMAMFNQISGLNAINFYSVTIFENVFDDNPNAATIGTALTGAAQIIGVLISPLLGSKISLKMILVLGTAICTVCMALVSLFAFLDVSILVLVFILLFLVSFQASQGSFFFTYVAEVAEDAGIGIANFTLFTFILLFAFITQDLFEAFDTAGTFALFAGTNLIGTFCMAFLLKDISGLSKSELKKLYSKHGDYQQSGVPQTVEEVPNGYGQVGQKDLAMNASALETPRQSSPPSP